MTCPVCGNESITIYENGGQYACCFWCGHREDTTMKAQERKFKLTCPDCGCGLKHGERGGLFCPKCGRMVDERDADRVDPKYAKEVMR